MASQQHCLRFMRSRIVIVGACTGIALTGVGCSAADHAGVTGVPVHKAKVTVKPATRSATSSGSTTVPHPGTSSTETTTKTGLLPAIGVASGGREHLSSGAP
jgi:hypothetical protein